MNNVKSFVKKKQTWTKVALERERKLLERDLESKRRKTHAGKINIPFGLKKELVDEWEIISQCNMVHKLPAAVTVMNALQEYKEGKIDVIRGVNLHSNNGNSKSLEKSTDKNSNNTNEFNQNNSIKKSCILSHHRRKKLSGKIW